MTSKGSPGVLTYPGGDIPFGPGQPILCVNDQMGYLKEEEEYRLELQAGKFDLLIEHARKGMALGLNVVNIQLMDHRLDEKALFPEAVNAIHTATGCCVGIDTRDPELVDAGLAAYPYKAMCNAVTGEWKSLETMLPIIAKHGAAIGTALVDEKGVPETAKERLRVARRIVEAAEEHGIPREDVMIDAICLPAGLHFDNLRITLETIKLIREELGVPTLLGVSNAGFMMPESGYLDLGYFIAAMSWGLDVAMIDPFTPALPWLANAMDFMMGVDEAGKGYLDYYRSTQT
jgi:5-methyltetrahydrofolate--homocysteine methyltransferase